MTPNSKLPSQEQLFQLFETIVASPEISKQMLANPSAVFQQNGITVADSNFVNNNFFTLFPQLKNHFTLGAAANAHPNALESCPDPKCIACQAGMAVTATVAIAAAIAGFPEDAPAIEALADLVGLSVEDITEILEGTSDIKEIISQICDKLGC